MSCCRSRQCAPKYASEIDEISKITSAEAETEPAGIKEIAAAAAITVSAKNNTPAEANETAAAKRHLRIERDALSAAGSVPACDPCLTLSVSLSILRRNRLSRQRKSQAVSFRSRFYKGKVKTSYATKRYPTQGSVSMCFGFEGSGSIFFLRFPTKTRRYSTWPIYSAPQILERSVRWVMTRS